MKARTSWFGVTSEVAGEDLDKLVRGDVPYQAKPGHLERSREVSS